MENLKKFRGTYKGLIGECMFRLTKTAIILTRLAEKRDVLGYYKDFLNEKQKEFLECYWHSIDAIEFNKKEKDVILYEVKTKNAYKNKSFPPKMTEHAHIVYNKAKAIGFIIRLVFIELQNNWNFEIKEMEFKKCYYCIDKPKRFDKKVESGNN